jgi:SAM-dependent methyltransferase
LTNVDTPTVVDRLPPTRWSEHHMTANTPTTTANASPEAVTDEVRARYAEVARAVLDRREFHSEATNECCSPSAAAGATTDPAWGELLYDAADRASLPDAAVLASLGCGNPTAVAELKPGEVVLDLGSGGGIDVLLSASRVGPTGFAYGLDMTDEMLELARRNAAEAGVTNVEFRKGRIESIPLGDASVDVVISNCVVNLSTDKAAVLAEVARVLRPGGRVGISDVVADDALSPTERAERGSFVGCIAGALSFAEYRAGLEAVGLTDISVKPTHAVGDGLHGAIVHATKPAGWSMADIRTVDLPKPSAVGLPVLVTGGGCCGDGCGCS